MVAKGLKVGDTFIDGASTYVIEKVLANENYISRRVKPRKTAAVKAPAEAPVEKRTRTRKSAE